VVDGTRRGRLLPDSFSRTLPLWAACLNKVVAAKRQSGEADGVQPVATAAAALEDEDAEGSAVQAAWAGRLYVPHATVPEAEAKVMQELVHERVAMLLEAQAPLDALVKGLDRPLRCCWHWRRPDRSATSSPLSAAAAAHSADQEYNVDDWDGEADAEELVAQGFIPIVCMSATRPIDEQPGDGFVYLQVGPGC
jgi:tRNA A64-2'-O-ribosylphosphate transferase